VAVATKNPVGLVVTTGIKGYGEMSGSSGIGGRIDQIVAEIVKQAEPRFRDQGWIK
jgi:thiamine pyrophosphokinase